MRRSRSVFSAAVVTALALGGISAASPASAVQDVATPQVSETTQAPQRVDPRIAIEAAKKEDLPGFLARLDLIKSSPAMVDVASHYPDPELVLEWYAAVSTQEQAKAIVANTAGRHFELAKASDGSNAVALVQNTSSGGASGAAKIGFNCWEAYVAYTAWSVAVGATCTAVGIMTIVGGVVCTGVYAAVSVLPNFNDAC